MGDVSGRRFYNELFSGCTFTRVAGASFIRCDMRGSHVAAEDVRDVLGVVFTADCFTFSGLRMSPTSLDGMLYLLTLTEGNDETRGRLRELIGSERLALFDLIFDRIE